MLSPVGRRSVSGWRKLLGRVLVVALIGLSAWAAWWLYDLGKLNGAAALESLRDRHQALQQRHEELGSEADTMRERVAVLERSSEIDRLAARDVKNELGSLQQELQTAREEIEFYRGIVSPGDVKPGLRIHRFTLSKGHDPDKFDYDLVLTQLKRNDRVVRGYVDWTILGKTGDGPTQLKLAEVTEAETGQLDFSFRYFQHLKGSVSLPEGFRAQQVTLSVKTKGKKAPEPVEQTFAWPGAGS